MIVVGVLSCVAALTALACLAVSANQKRQANTLIYGASAAICGVGLACALAALYSGAASTVILPLGLPWLGMHFRVDALAAAFLCVVNVGGVAASVFALGYGRHEAAPQRVLPFFPAFLAAMNLVVIADDAFTFLLSWELMSLMSWALVISHDRTAENMRAGLIYIVMASFGTLALLLAFGILAGPDGLYAFSSMRAHGLNSNYTMIVMLLTLIGAGSKAGIFPLHTWLPLAHPAAPSHASALMSGVMTKVAVYAFIRIVFDLLGPIDWRLAMIVIGVGAVTALMGVLYALMQHDLKRLLAYHTVENIGIIFVGLGLALAFRANGLAAAAALAATAALFHVFNHSLFKSLLFFGAGAVQTTTGERDMDHLGGLIHTMPRTAIAFLVGAAAISALPPLNGFASEWLTFQAVFLSSTFPQWGLRLLAPAAGALLALSAALAAACFVKAFGISFLGRARSNAAQNAKETDKASLTAMLGLAAACGFAGIFPGLFTNLLAPATQFLTTSRMPVQAMAAPWTPLLPVAASHNSYSGFVIATCLVIATALTASVVRAFANNATRRSAAWDCGYPEASPTTQYTAGSFAQPIRRVFATIAFRAREQVTMPAPTDTGAAQFLLTLRDPAWDFLYTPIGRSVDFLADHFNRFQFLTIRRYLGLVFLTLVFLLTVLVLWA
ncbi:MAG: hydrogenase 4 subunit B [Alphaproteobacteria bacterium]|nr:hydrogenase 4 subunit B [Alphaproteobacteria bacterium]